MNEVVAIVEGPTEQAFVRDPLAAHLALHGSTVWAVLPGRGRNQGGVSKWPTARDDIVRTLKEGRYCTTMFDYYGLPHSWPGRSEAGDMPWNRRASHVEAEVHKAIAEQMGDSWDAGRFIPYIQLHEFEALLFADVNTLAEVAAPLAHQAASQLQARFRTVLDESGSPEAINDNYQTCPSRRIRAEVRGYSKTVHGPIVARRIGLAHLRDQCPHFASWLARLESLE